MSMQKQRCATCGQEWLDSHACGLKLTAAAPAQLAVRTIEFSSGAERAAWMAKNMPAHIDSACACIGPKNGQPLCPCAMRAVVVKDGRYTLPERYLGPVVVHEGRGNG